MNFSKLTFLCFSTDMVPQRTTH